MEEPCERISPIPPLNTSLTCSPAKRSWSELVPKAIPARLPTPLPSGLTVQRSICEVYRLRGGGGAILRFNSRCTGYAINFGAAARVVETRLRMSSDTIFIIIALGCMAANYDYQQIKIIQFHLYSILFKKCIRIYDDILEKYII